MHGHGSAGSMRIYIQVECMNSFNANLAVPEFKFQ